MIIRVNSREDIKKLGTIVEDYGNMIIIEDLGKFSLTDDEYPKYFKCFETFDSYSDYFETSRNEYINYLNDNINRLEEELSLYRDLIEEEI